MTSLHDTHRQDVDNAWLPVTNSIEFQCSLLDSTSPEYQRVFRKFTRPYKKLIDANSLPPKLDREIAVKVFVTVCVKNWRTVIRDDDGNVTGYRMDINTKGDTWLEYSEKNAIDVLVAYPRLFRDATTAAADHENYQLDEDEAKNSKSA